MKSTEDSMGKTTTVTGRVSQEAKDRLKEIVRESGGDEEEIVGEAVERLLNDTYWEEEIRRRQAVPREERLYVDPDEMRRWVKARTTETPAPAPKGKPLSEL